MSGGSPAPPRAAAPRGNGHAQISGVGESLMLGSRSRARMHTVMWLGVAVGVLAVVGSAAGLLWQGSGDPVTVTTLRGETAELYGRGLYADDTLFVVGNNRSNDIVSLVLGIPLLVTSLWLYVKGSFRGALLLLGTLAFFLYSGGSYALGAVAYNPLFLIYVGLFAASLWALVATLTSIDRRSVAFRFAPDAPRRGPGLFMLAGGIVTFAIWIMDPLDSLLTGEPPDRLDTYTTLFTHAVDIGVIVPAAVLAGWMILKGDAFGYVVAFSLLILEAFLMPLITIATIVQIRLGLSFAPGEVVGPIAGFSVLAVLSIWVIVRILRAVEDPVAITEDVTRR